MGHYFLDTQYNTALQIMEYEEQQPLEEEQIVYVDPPPQQVSIHVHNSMLEFS